VDDSPADDFEGPHLTESERPVFRELRERERDSSYPRLSATYYRMLELSRSTHPVDAVLTAHLARELLSALPGALGVEIPRERAEYENLVAQVSESWPEEARTNDPPPGTIAQLRRLLSEHEAASGRARRGPRELLAREDRARSGYVPDLSLDRWTELQRRGSGLAHRLRNLQQELPDSAETRRIVNEVTATLLATITPYFVGIGEVDRLLATESPTGTEASDLAALLRTPSQYRYFFDRADERWLRPLAEIPRLLSTPPDLIDVGGGYVQAPVWPQGTYLARVAASDPALVAELVERVAATTNPRVTDQLIEMARRLPPETAAGLVPSLARRISTPLAVEFAAIDAGKLARELGQAGFADDGMQLLMATINAAIAGSRDMRSHVEQLLAEPLEAVAAAGSDIGARLRALLRKRLRNVPVRRRHSTLWLRSVDRRPRYGADVEWFIANGLHRVLVVAPPDAARSLANTLLKDREPVMRRVALASMAARPELISASDALLHEAARWDDEATTRYEFRRALGELWSRASESARAALLDYAATATEADEIIERYAVNGMEHDPDEIRRRWRSRLLHAVRAEVPREWTDRFGPLDELDDDRLPDPIVEWGGPVSPISEDELSDLDPAEVLTRLGSSSADTHRGLERPTLEGLGRTGAAVIVRRFAEFAGLGADVAQLPVAVTAQITSALERSLREDEAVDRGAIVDFVLALGEVFLSEPAGGEEVATEEAAVWSREIRRDISGTLSYAANKEALGQAESHRALALLDILLRDADPTEETDTRDAENGYDPGMLALNSLRGEATTAAIELLLEARRTNRNTLADATAAMLRRVVAADQSRSVRAAIGIRLPWILASDEPHQAEWIDLLFGEAVPTTARTAAWDAYLLYSRFFSNEATKLAGQYDLAVATHEPQPEDETGRRRQTDEHLGIHVAAAHVLGLEVERRGNWLTEFYRRAAGWSRARVTRWIAEQAAEADAAPEIRGRARDFLRQRIASADGEADAEELKAVAWIASATDASDENLELLLAALEKTAGATENEPGAVALAARMSPTRPRSAARLVQLLVEGDEWHSLPHVASAELQDALQQLISSSDKEAMQIASDVINTLGAQGFLEFRSLLDSRPAS
jgi:hypothetical protein